MFDTFLYNLALYNSLAESGAVLAASTLIFNNYDLQNGNIISSILVQDNTPTRDFQTSDIPRGHGQIITGDFMRRKTITVSGVIQRDTNILLESEIDAMKKALYKEAGNLDITIAGVVRRYKATLTNGSGMFSQRKGYHITFCPFQLEFVSVEPFGKLIPYTSKGFLGTTDLSFNEQINNNGTIETKPVVILNFVAAVGVTAISFKNNTRSEEIKLTKAINAGDYVRFDSETLEVTVNGVVQDYTGAFPLLDTDANSITITVTGTSCEYDLTVKHKTSFL